MTDEPEIKLSLRDVSFAVALPEDAVVELVEHGIVSPPGGSPSSWSFDLTMVSVVRRATRLHHDLELDWSAVAMVCELLEERDRLLEDNRRLQQRLRRFLL
ncbi:MAG: chaperone modulator CbpM [Pseudohongiellaceae bacterium]